LFNPYSILENQEDIMMNEEANLKSAYQYIRKEYFPLWDKKCQWRIKLDKNDPREGLCDLENKEITISSIPESETDLHLLLIHEICHFVSPTHGSKWQKRMTKVAERADRIGRNVLAEAIRNQIKFYVNVSNSEISLKHVYNAIEDAVGESLNSSFEQIIEYVADSVGCTQEELMKSAKRARKVYDRAKVDVEYEAIARRSLVKGNS
jgi:hypothetical protein